MPFCSKYLELREKKTFFVLTKADNATLINKLNNNIMTYLSREVLATELTAKYSMEAIVWNLSEQVTFLGNEAQCIKLYFSNPTKEGKVFYSENLKSWAVSFYNWYTTEFAQTIDTGLVVEETEDIEIKEVVSANAEINKSFLSTITKQAKELILIHISKRYQVSTSDILNEIFDNEAENILEYMVGKERQAAQVLMKRHGFC